MSFNKFLQQALTDIKVKLEAEFKENFTRKAFFNEKWKNTKSPNSRGSLMLRTGNLRNSIRSELRGSSIVFSSSMPYANIHNNGGEISVTPQMRKFFWAMHLKTGQKDKKTAEAERWKALALMKIGSKIKIEKRQFIGFHSETDKIIREIINHHLEEITKELNKTLKK